MRFGPVPVEDSVGAISAHTLNHAGFVLRKGETVSFALAAALGQAGLREIVVARLEAGDVAENEAALRLAEAVVGDHVRIDRAFTGRANLFAEAAGVLRVDAAIVDRVNDQDEAITLATLPPFRAVVAGEMVGTVKIIPFAVAGASLAAALRSLEVPPLSIVPFRPLRIGVVSTILPGLKPGVVAKTLRVLEQRLAPAGATIAREVRVPHDTGALAGALRDHRSECDLLIVFGASAITDRRDVIPAGLIEAGGRIEHFGMPVDPGNLLLLGSLDGRPVLGAPGCARSPKENGFDWVLQRLLAGLAVTSADLRNLGVGGLLMEIVSRPQPRSGDTANFGAEDPGEDRA